MATTPLLASMHQLTVVVVAAGTDGNMGAGGAARPSAGVGDKGVAMGANDAGVRCAMGARCDASDRAGGGRRLTDRIRKQG